MRNRVLDEEELEIDEPILAPFDFARYKNSLNDIVEYDDEGIETSRRRPTDEEAKNTQVNSFSGQEPRDLNIYEF